jgi:hypothetical protein
MALAEEVEQQDFLGPSQQLPDAYSYGSTL